MVSAGADGGRTLAQASIEDPRHSGLDELDVPGQLLVEKQGLVNTSDVVESDAVRVSSGAPDEHDVVHEHAAVIRGRRNVDRVHALPIDVHPADWPNPRPRVR
jgi:hypothetical protein